MANTLMTPTWVTQETAQAFMNEFDARIRQQGDTIRVKLPARYAAKTSAPIDGKVLLALGAAAVIASPRKVSRRGFMGIGWKDDVTK